MHLHTRLVQSRSIFPTNAALRSSVMSYSPNVILTKHGRYCVTLPVSLSKACCQIICHYLGVHWKNLLMEAWIQRCGSFMRSTITCEPPMIMNCWMSCINAWRILSTGTYEEHIMAYRWIPVMGSCERISQARPSHG